MNDDRELLRELAGGCNVFFEFTPYNLLVLDALLELEHIACRPSLVINTCKREYKHASVKVINFRRSEQNWLSSALGYWRMSGLLPGLRKSNAVHSVYSPHPHKQYVQQHAV
ncbi:MAG: hypothetical protein ACJAUG_001103 [Halioglobus sp.]|jgi:hypothetical protein